MQMEVVVMMVLIQEFTMMKLLKIPEKRIRCMIFTFVYTFFFMEAEHYIALYITQTGNNGYFMILFYNLWHILFTFVLLAQTGICAEGYLPRNFIRIFLYYNILITLITQFIAVNITAAAAGVPASECMIGRSGMYSVYVALLSAVLYMIFTSLINRPLTRLLAKLPDKVCDMIFAAVFLSLMIKIAFALNSRNVLDSLSERYMISRDNIIILICDLGIMIGGMLVICILVFMQSANRRRFEKFIMLGTAMQEDYYCSVADITKRIREIRHDLANHMLVLSEGAEDGKGYRDQLYAMCSEIDERIDQALGWRIIGSTAVSDREKYEIYRFLISVCDLYGLDRSSVSVSNGRSRSEITLQLPLSAAACMRIRRQTLYRLVRYIARNNGGSVIWHRKDAVYSLHINI